MVMGHESLQRLDGIGQDVSPEQAERALRFVLRSCPADAVPDVIEALGYSSYVGHAETSGTYRRSFQEVLREPQWGAAVPILEA